MTRDAVVDVLRAAVFDGKVQLNRDRPKGQRAKIKVVVRSEFALPVSQGFGMSAAGALSTALALVRALGMGRSYAIEAAHTAEIANRTGLGDVAGAATGGWELRKSPGIPPYGATDKFVGFGDVVVGVVGPPIATSTILGDAKRRDAVNAAGARLLDGLFASPGLEAFFDASRRFAEESGLATPEVRRALGALDAVRDCRASMSMLGNSVFAVGPVERIEEALKAFGPTWRCRVDAEGARPLTIETPRA